MKTELNTILDRKAVIEALRRGFKNRNEFRIRFPLAYRALREKHPDGLDEAFPVIDIVAENKEKNGNL